MGLLVQNNSAGNDGPDYQLDGTELIALARSANDPAILVSTLISLGTAYERATRLSEAKACYAEAAQICRNMEKPDASQFAASIGHLGDILVVEGRVTEALPLFEEGVDIAKRYKRVIDEANCLRQIGTTYMTLWEPRPANKYLSLALDLYRAGGWAFLEVAALVHIAWSRSMAGDVEEAAEILDVAARCIAKIAHPWLFGTTLLTFARGDIHYYKGDHDLALATFRGVRAIYQYKLPMRDYEAEVLKRLGFLAMVQQRYTDAEQAFIVSAVLNWKTEEFINIAIALTRLADVWLAEGDVDAAINLTLAIGPQIVRLGSGKEFADIQLRFALAAKSRQNLVHARETVLKALKEYERVEWRYGINRCQELLSV
ncbi:TPR-like protein [Exidia glandulosa HHB12029]|uniref:TPR-like protein n=1 Tax=Exidia glandulosa HHB12029 TaxID=1314781 RepID=A0A166BET2_EXIGL|nr:TPR-like protein [Exidia glandulosa HHB12029]